MKKFIPAFAIALLAIAFSSCGPNLYKSTASGKDNVSYIVILTEGRRYEGLSVVVDGNRYPYGKVYKVKMKRKAQPVVIEPGRHNVKVMKGDGVLVEENIFIGLQETKQFLLR